MPKVEAKGVAHPRVLGPPVEMVADPPLVFQVGPLVRGALLDRVDRRVPTSLRFHLQPLAVENAHCTKLGSALVPIVDSGMKRPRQKK